jgi:hypothetical protein
VGRCPDAGVYRITEDDGYHTVHNLLLVEQEGAGCCWPLRAATALAASSASIPTAASRS